MPVASRKVGCKKIFLKTCLKRFLVKCLMLRMFVWLVADSKFLFDTMLTKLTFLKESILLRNSSWSLDKLFTIDSQ